MFTSRHFPDVIPATEKKKKNPTRQCNLCSLKRDSRGKPVSKNQILVYRMSGITLYCPLLQKLSCKDYTLEKQDWK